MDPQARYPQEVRQESPGGILNWGVASVCWYSAKRAACPNKVLAHMWFMHDAEKSSCP